MDVYDQRVDRGRVCCAIALLPVVFVCLWLEAIGGSAIAWDGDNRWAFAGWAVAVIGPAVLVIATLRTRPMREHMARRVFRIEVWTLIAALPGALLCLLAIMAAAVI